MAAWLVAEKTGTDSVDGERLNKEDMVRKNSTGNNLQDKGRRRITSRTWEDRRAPWKCSSGGSDSPDRVRANT